MSKRRKEINEEDDIHTFYITNDGEEMFDSKSINSNETLENDIEYFKETIGFVTDCLRLNIRNAPKLNSDIVCVKELASKLIIDDTKSNEEWYFVSDDSGNCGFCMRKYIKLYEG